MKQAKYYTCEYCYIEYIPKRRGVQKYCSNSCRSNACRVRNSNINKIETISVMDNKLPNKSIEQMSAVGVGNATVGVILANTLKTVFTKEDDKPVTKGDIKVIIEKLKGRYHLVNNMMPLENGHYPYFDLEKNIIVYLNAHNNIL